MMYICKNCGLQYVADEAVVCVKCGTPRGAGNQFCPCCGNQTQPEMAVCMQCGVDTTQYGVMQSSKSKVVAGVLGLFLGCYGAHNFYLGKIKRAVIQISLIAFAFISMIVAATCMDIFVYEMSDMTAGLMFILMIVGVITILGVELWVFIESIMILCGKIDKDGKGFLLQ